MQQTIEIPTPSRADTETVSTALETAAVFRSKGDGREAMRWLQRAAESAGAAGDDERALSLSRVAADLHAELDVPEPPKALPPPPPSPPPSSRAAPPSSSSMRASHPAPPSSRAAPSSSSSLRASHPAPPSSRAPEPTPSVPPTFHATGARQAARVAIAISTTKAGVFELRLLADGESARIGSSEALLVMLDPTSTLLNRT
jgi:hypothetical protein